MSPVPQPSVIVFPRMYTPGGELVHRVTSTGPTPLCQRVPAECSRAIEGRPELEFDPEHADKLRVCRTCDDRVRRYT